MMGGRDILEIENREPQLAAHAARLSGDPGDATALHLHLSGLSRENARPFHLRLCLQFLRPFLQRHDGTLFGTSAGDMVVVFGKIDETPLAELRDGRGADLLMVEPAPIVAPLPTSTGATSSTPEPIKALSPMTVRYLFAPS